MNCVQQKLYCFNATLLFDYSTLNYLSKRVTPRIYFLVAKKFSLLICQVKRMTAIINNTESLYARSTYKVIETDSLNNVPELHNQMIFYLLQSRQYRMCLHSSHRHCWLCSEQFWNFSFRMVFRAWSTLLWTETIPDSRIANYHHGRVILTSLSLRCKHYMERTEIDVQGG